MMRSAIKAAGLAAVTIVAVTLSGSAKTNAGEVLASPTILAPKTGQIVRKPLHAGRLGHVCAEFFPMRKLPAGARLDIMVAKRDGETIDPAKTTHFSPRPGIRCIRFMVPDVRRLWGWGWLEGKFGQIFLAETPLRVLPR